MSIQRHDTRTQSPQRYGKPGVSYPYGDLAFPRIVETRTAKKGLASSLIPFLTPHRDQGSYPGAVLIEQTSDVGDDTDKNITETYEVLPGPIFVEVSEFQGTGIPILVSKQKVAAPDDYNEGEIVPASINVESIAAGNPCTVTLASAHELPPRAWVTFAGAVSALNGNQRIVAVPSPTQVQIAVNIASPSGAAGTMTGINRVFREMKPTGNVNVLMKVESMVAVPDVTVFNESITNACKDYSFPDFLKAIHGYLEESSSDTVGATEFGLTTTDGGSFGLQIQNGYRGLCKGTRLRLFAMGPTAISSAMSSYSPTLVIPSSGTVVVESESFSIQVSSGGTATSTSSSFKSGTIPPVLTPRRTAPDSLSGFGQAAFFVDLPASTPTSFTQGQTITLIEEPQKLGVGLWQVFVWQLTVPYTMGGGAPASLSYTINPVTYASTVAITPNNPSWSGGDPHSFSVSPALPTGLVLNGVTGIITGTPATPTGSATYTVTATNTSGSTTVGLVITIS